AVRLGLLPHTTSRRQPWRLTTAGTACSCLQLAVATTSPREGLSPPIQCPCQAHLRRSAPRNDDPVRSDIALDQAALRRRGSGALVVEQLRAPFPLFGRETVGVLGGTRGHGQAALH